MTTTNGAAVRMFYTVREAAAELRVNKNTLYRAIHDNAFPAVKIRSRFIVPAKAIEQLLERAIETGQPVDPARMAAERRAERELVRRAPEWR
jgi:excisionase family DNA binding protein